MGKEIIIVTISLGNDGAERILTELARQWHHDGHKITVIQTSPNRYGTEYALPEGIEQIQIHTTSSNKILRFLQEIKALIGILKQRPNATCLSWQLVLGLLIIEWCSLSAIIRARCLSANINKCFETLRFDLLMP